MGAETTAIGSLVEGERVRVRGRIRAAEASLESPLDERPCVFFEVRNLVEDEAGEREARDFFVEDGSGEVVVRADRLEVRAASRSTEEAIPVLDANIHDVSQRIRELKGILKQQPAARDLRTEMKGLRAVATLLCAVRAHARGNVHIGGTLEGQVRYIRERTPKVRVDEQVKRLLVERHQTTLEVGQEVTVEGIARRESVRDSDAPRGYRDAPLSTRWVIVAPPDGVVVVTGTGGAAPGASSGAREGRRSGEGGDDRTAASPAWSGLSADWAVPAGVATAIAIAVYVLTHC